MKIVTSLKNKGFTLVELILTIGFIVFGAAIVTGVIFLAIADFHFITKYW